VGADVELELLHATQRGRHGQDEEAAVAAIPAVVAFFRARDPRPSRYRELFYDFYVIACVLVIFDGLGPLIRAVNPVDRDSSLVAFDRWLFGGTDPTVALERIATPFLSDVLTVFYALYYFHPIVLGILVYLDDRKRPPEAREFPRYREGTLMSYHRHTASPDVLADPGNRDITAHVPFSVMERELRDAGMEPERFEKLALFLLSVGEADQFAAALAGADEREALKRRMQLKTLLYGMGETFRVLVAKSARK